MTIKGTFWDDFNNLLTSLRAFSDMHTHKAKAHSCTDHMQHIRRVQHVMCHVAQRDSPPINPDRVEIIFSVTFISLAETINQWDRRVPRENPRLWAPENAIYYSPNSQAPPMFHNHTPALVKGTCWESRCANLCLTYRTWQSWNHLVLFLSH